MNRWLTSVGLLTAIVLCCGAARAQEYLPPRDVKVLPIFFIPKGEAAPTDDESARLMRHLEWARTRYQELLPNRKTFRVAEQTPRLYRAQQSLDFYRTQPEAAAPAVVSELLADLKVNRYNCPYVLLAVMMNSHDGFPEGGARTLNGGFNTGGGIVELSSFTLNRSPNFQSTLQHELGHSFGLPHVDVYGYDMKANDSFMSYNPNHHTNGFRPSATPGRLIPEDYRGLAFNQRVFPGLKFHRKRDVPPGYTLSERVVWLGPMKIPGQRDGIEVTTESGEDFNSHVANIVQGRILPSKNTGNVTFQPQAMWQSAKSATGWVAMQLTFPFEVELSRVAVHSQHSGLYHIACDASMSLRDAGGKFQQVAKATLKSADDSITFPKTKGQTFRLELHAGESGIVVVRGLQFFSGENELFPPLVPYEE